MKTDMSCAVLERSADAVKWSIHTDRPGVLVGIRHLLEGQFLCQFDVEQSPENAEFSRITISVPVQPAPGKANNFITEEDIFAMQYFAEGVCAGIVLMQAWPSSEVPQTAPQHRRSLPGGGS